MKRRDLLKMLGVGAVAGASGAVTGVAVKCDEDQFDTPNPSVDVKRAEMENELFASHEGNPRTIPFPSPWDAHRAHMRVHEKFLKENSADMTVSKEINLRIHIRAHEIALREQMKSAGFVAE